jgi:hypothetical protein
MLHNVLVAIATALYVFAVLVGVLRPLVWHPFKLLTDADYAQAHQERGLAIWRDGGRYPGADASERAQLQARLDELRGLRRQLGDADPETLRTIDARERALALRLGAPVGARGPEASGAAAHDPVGANARWILWAVASASLASVLLAIDGFIGLNR